MEPEVSEIATLVCGGRQNYIIAFLCSKRMLKCFPIRQKKDNPPFKKLTTEMESMILRYQEIIAIFYRLSLNMHLFKV